MITTHEQHVENECLAVLRNSTKRMDYIDIAKEVHMPIDWVLHAMDRLETKSIVRKVYTHPANRKLYYELK